MDNSKYEKLARDCIKRVFHDCRFLYLVKASDVKLMKGTNCVLIKGKECGITASRTVKTVINGNKKCVSCNLVSKYVAVVKNVNTHKTNVIFFVEGEDNTFIPLTKDHIVAKARGGTDKFKNLQSMCSVCNTEKADLIVGQSTNADELLIYKNHYDSLITKQRDFSYTRKQIKKVIQSLPWYMKLLGIHRYIEKKLKEPLVEKGYYSCNETIDNSK